MTPRRLTPGERYDRAQTVIIRIEGHAPDVRLAANDRGNMHWGQRSSLVGVEFDKAHWLYKAFFKGNVPPRYTVPVTVAFRVRMGREYGRLASRDVDNLAGACKVWLDALTTGRGNRDGLGLLFDDSPKWVRGVSYGLDTTEGEPYTEITISPIMEGKG